MVQRIVSLVPSGTEIVAALGATGRLVGVSHECDHPLEVAELPRLTRPLISASGSAEIDREVREKLEQQQALYALDIDLLCSLRPDLIVTQELCHVCAPAYPDVVSAARDTLGDSVQIVSLNPRRLDDLYAGIEQVARPLGDHATAQELISGLKRRAGEIEDRLAGAPRPRVLTLEWIDPPMVGALWMAELIELAGGVPLATAAGESSRVLSMEELESLEPEVVVVKPCGFGLERALEELRSFRAQVPWRRWPAARDGRVYFCDGSAWFNRPGPRLIDSIEVLAACFRPELFKDFRWSYGHGIAQITRDLMVVRW